jgi:60 kDa SS-A/Ro ribonucleoprotein
MSYLKNAFAVTPQKPNTPVTVRTASNQVVNNDSGFVYKVSDRDRLLRFLVLGSEGGTYYVKEQKLTEENAQSIKAMILADGASVVQAVVEISKAGRAPKNDPALFVLAMCAAFGDITTRQMALSVLPQVARIGTHLFHFVDYLDSMGGWGRAKRTAVGAWYTEKDPKDLAFQIVKYGQRDGWSHADILRKAHPKIGPGALNDLLKYAVDGWPGVGELPHSDEALAIVWAAERVKVCEEAEAIRLIQQYRLPMEVVPTEKRTKAVYECLLPHAPITWLIRNLGTLSKIGVIAEGQYSNLNAVCAKITDVDVLAKGRVHPLSVLVAHNTYKGGRGIRGSSEWPVIQKVIDALDAAFELAFEAIEPTHARFVLGLDVSASMNSGAIAGMIGITPRIGTAAMALVTARTEKNVASMAFSSGFVPFPIGAHETLNSVIMRMNAMPFDSTDCSLPMLWAMQHRIEADAFVVYTDSETNSGVHPMQALRDYRQAMGIPAKLVVVGMTATGFTIADPNDGGSMDVVGFDTSAPAVISQFATP